MTKHYALIDELGKVTQTIQTSEELEAPWILIEQPIITSKMVFDPADGIFKEPTE